MTNEQLVSQIKAGEKVEENMEALYKQVRLFIHSMALRYRESGEMEDLEQEGYLALYPAIAGYDPEQGTKFLTYAEYHIRQRMRRYLQQSGSVLRIPMGQDEKIKKYKKFCNAFQLEHGREPSERETAALMGLTLEQVREIQENASMTQLGSLDAPVTGIDGGEDTTMGDLVACPESLEDKLVEQIQGDQLKTALWGCVDALQDRQAEVIRQRYQEGMTLAEIGRQNGISPEAVRQIHTKALRELRKTKHCSKIRPFLDETEIYGMVLAGSGVDRFQQTWTSSTERAAFQVMDWEAKRQERMELLEKVRRNVATSQQGGKCGEKGDKADGAGLHKQE
ncbi:sigma-70 family RNA polymerase sigma factor [Clostridium sp. AN503]|uniref:sigma-70 family RNA polymerase sigma factor n=1 Tax=Clostridium sp. AN503 TaxID=3160598 RepID=UPI003459392E